MDHTVSLEMKHTHNCLMALCPGLPGWAPARKVEPIWILLKQETVSGSGISWAICKSAPCCRQITMPAPYHSVFTGQMPFLPPNQQRQRTEGSETETEHSETSSTRRNKRCKYVHMLTCTWVGTWAPRGRGKCLWAARSCQSEAGLCDHSVQHRTSTASYSHLHNRTAGTHTFLHVTQLWSYRGQLMTRHSMKPATAVVCQLVYLAVERAAQLTTEWREELTTTTAVMPAGHQHPARTAAEDHLTDTRTDRNTQEAGATRWMLSELAHPRTECLVN